MEHRSTEQIARHLGLFWAILSCFLPALLTSSSTVLLQLFLGRAACSACLVTLHLVFLRVCPIQPHFRLLIWMLILSRSVVVCCCSFVMTSSQWMPMMDLRHLLTKVCSLVEFVFATLHVSEP